MKDIVGMRFGRLTVLQNDPSKQYFVICECDCGNRKSVRKASLTMKNSPTRSCGCIQRESASVTGRATISSNSAGQIEKNVAYNTNFQVITSDKPPKNNTSGVKGVSWCQSRSMWEAYIMVRRKRIALGRYAHFEDAVKARKEAENQYHAPLIEEANKHKEEHT